MELLLITAEQLFSNLIRLHLVDHYYSGQLNEGLGPRFSVESKP